MGGFVRGKECLIEDWMDFLPRSGEFETICGESFFAKDFEGAIPFLTQLLAGSHHGDVGSF